MTKAAARRTAPPALPFLWPVMAAEHLLGTPKRHLLKQIVPGGHFGLFMGGIR